jgi:cell division protein FtsN
MKNERGGLVLGLVIGLLVGLALALGVALYVTKAPIPFINKVPQRTADQDAQEAERNRNWDPNAGLVGRSASVPVGVAGEASAATGAVARGPAGEGGRDPAAILAGVPAPAVNPNARLPASLPPVEVRTPTPVAGVSAKPGADAFVYFVQAGAFQSGDEAEQQRARLAMMGVQVKVIEREQSGRTVFRVRAGPFEKQSEADALKERLAASQVEALLVRVER